MNTTKLKKFAAEARINLMDGVRRKLRLLGFDERGRVIGKARELIEGGTLWNEEEFPECQISVDDSSDARTGWLGSELLFFSDNSGNQ